MTKRKTNKARWMSGENLSRGLGSPILFKSGVTIHFKDGSTLTYFPYRGLKK